MKFSPYQCQSFEDFIYQFARRYQLFPRDNGHLWLAVSGGADSMTLLEIVNQWRKRGLIDQFSVSHVNHQTRGEENIKEQQLVQHYCQKLDVVCRIHYAGAFDANGENFEHWARNQRLEFLQKLAGEQDKVWMAHHLDDSYEWSLMRRSSGGNLRSQLGIPLFNSLIARPLHCVSREQLSYYRKARKTPYLEDSSNFEVHYERNYLRHWVIPKLAERYPKYLKHYALSANQNWEMLRARKKLDSIRVCQDVQIAGWENGKRPGLGELQELIHRVSPVKRGVLSAQVKILQQLIGKGGGGPVAFPGGLQVFVMTNQLIFTQNRNLFDDCQRFQSTSNKRLRLRIEELEQILQDTSVVPLFWLPKCEENQLALRGCLRTGIPEWLRVLEDSRRRPLDPWRSCRVRKKREQWSAKRLLFEVGHWT